MCEELPPSKFNTNMITFNLLLVFIFVLFVYFLNKVEKKGRELYEMKDKPI